MAFTAGICIRTLPIWAEEFIEACKQLHLRHKVIDINKFKKGFSGDYIFYPKTMYIPVCKVKYYLYMTLHALSQRIKAFYVRFFGNSK